MWKELASAQAASQLREMKFHQSHLIVVYQVGLKTAEKQSHLVVCALLYSHHYYFYDDEDYHGDNDNDNDYHYY